MPSIICFKVQFFKVMSFYLPLRERSSLMRVDRVSIFMFPALTAWKHHLP